MGWEHMIGVQVQSDQLAHASGDRLTRKALSALARNRERAGEIQMSTQQAGTGCGGRRLGSQGIARCRLSCLRIPNRRSRI